MFLGRRTIFLQDSCFIFVTIFSIVQRNSDQNVNRNRRGLESAAAPPELQAELIWCPFDLLLTPIQDIQSENLWKCPTCSIILRLHPGVLRH